MNINKFTQKSMQAVQDCEKLAYQYGNQEIDQEHLIEMCIRDRSRCARTKTATALISSGTTKLRSCKKAYAFDAFKSASVPRGLTPVTT